MSSSRTLWEEGRRPGRLVVIVSALATLLVVVLDLVVTGKINFVYDIAFVAICVSAALWVHPRDFFVVGVFPPLLMAGTVLTLAVFSRNSIADPGDGLIQSIVSGLAHRSGALVAGYGLSLAVLAIRRATYARRRAAVTARTSSSPPAMPTSGSAARPADPGLQPAVGQPPTRHNQDSWLPPAAASGRRRG